MQKLCFIGSRSSRRVGFASCQPTTHGPIFVQSVSNGSAFSETSVAVVPLDPNDPRKRNYVIGYNQNFNGRRGRPAWSVSLDHGETWQSHLETDNGGWGDPAEATLGSLGQEHSIGS